MEHLDTFYVIYLYTHANTHMCNKFFGFVFNPFLRVNVLEPFDILYFLQTRIIIVQNESELGFFFFKLNNKFGESIKLWSLNIPGIFRKAVGSSFRIDIKYFTCFEYRIQLLLFGTAVCTKEFVQFVADYGCSLRFSSICGFLSAILILLFWSVRLNKIKCPISRCVCIMLVSRVLCGLKFPTSSGSYVFYVLIQFLSNVWNIKGKFL